MAHLRLVGSACFLLLFAVFARAEDAARPGVIPAATTATPAVPVTSSTWDLTTTVRLSGGWRDNVTSSALNPIDRAFWRGEADWFVVRPLGHTFRFVSFLSGDVLRYFSPPPSATGEQEWLAHAELRWEPTDWLRTSLKASGFLQDAVVDPSSLEGGLQSPVWVRLQGGYATLTPRLKLPAGFTLEPSLQVKRIDYKRNYNGDYQESRPGVRLEWKRWEVLALSAAWHESVRHYSELLQLKNNREQRGWRLSLHQREVEGRVTSRFEAAGSWTLSATGARLESRDRAYGFLDYNEQRGALDVDWNRRAWTVHLGGEARRYDYLNQNVGVGAQTMRIADAFDVNARIERELAPKWTVFAEEHWERSRSNLKADPPTDNRELLSYRTNTVLVGVQRTF